MFFEDTRAQNATQDDVSDSDAGPSQPAAEAPTATEPQLARVVPPQIPRISADEEPVFTAPPRVTQPTVHRDLERFRSNPHYIRYFAANPLPDLHAKSKKQERRERKLQQKQQLLQQQQQQADDANPDAGMLDPPAPPPYQPPSGHWAAQRYDAGLPPPYAAPPSYNSAVTPSVTYTDDGLAGHSSIVADASLGPLLTPPSRAAPPPASSGPETVEGVLEALRKRVMADDANIMLLRQSAAKYEAAAEAARRKVEEMEARLRGAELETAAAQSAHDAFAQQKQHLERHLHTTARFATPADAAALGTQGRTARAAPGAVNANAPWFATCDTALLEVVADAAVSDAFSSPFVLRAACSWTPCAAASVGASQRAASCAAAVARLCPQLRLHSDTGGFAFILDDAGPHAQTPCQLERLNGAQGKPTRCCDMACAKPHAVHPSHTMFLALDNLLTEAAMRSVSPAQELFVRRAARRLAEFATTADGGAPDARMGALVSLRQHLATTAAAVAAVPWPDLADGVPLSTGPCDRALQALSDAVVPQRIAHFLVDAASDGAVRPSDVAAFTAALDAKDAPGAAACIKAQLENDATSATAWHAMLAHVRLHATLVPATDAAALASWAVRALPDDAACHFELVRALCVPGATDDPLGSLLAQSAMRGAHVLSDRIALLAHGELVAAPAAHSPKAAEIIVAQKQLGVLITTAAVGLARRPHMVGAGAWTEHAFVRFLEPLATTPGVMPVAPVCQYNWAVLCVHFLLYGQLPRDLPLAAVVTTPLRPSLQSDREAPSIPASALALRVLNRTIAWLCEARQGIALASTPNGDGFAAQLRWMESAARAAVWRVSHDKKAAVPRPTLSAHQCAEYMALKIASVAHDSRQLKKTTSAAAKALGTDPVACLRVFAALRCNKAAEVALDFAMAALAVLAKERCNAADPIALTEKLDTTLAPDEADAAAILCATALCNNGMEQRARTLLEGRWAATCHTDGFGFSGMLLRETSAAKAEATGSTAHVADMVRQRLRALAADDARWSRGLDVANIGNHLIGSAHEEALDLFVHPTALLPPPMWSSATVDAVQAAVLTAALAVQCVHPSMMPFIDRHAPDVAAALRGLVVTA